MQVVSRDHDGRGEGQVSGDGREVERRDGGNESFEWSVPHLKKNVRLINFAFLTCQSNCLRHPSKSVKSREPA